MVNIWLNIYIYIYIYLSIYLSINLSIYLSIHTYIHTYIHTHIHTYIHTDISISIYLSIYTSYISLRCWETQRFPLSWAAMHLTTIQGERCWPRIVCRHLSTQWFSKKIRWTMNIWWTYGENMVKIWWKYGENMVNIWWTYGENMVKIWWNWWILPIFKNQSQRILFGRCPVFWKNWPGTCIGIMNPSFFYAPNMDDSYGGFHKWGYPQMFS